MHYISPLTLRTHEPNQGLRHVVIMGSTGSIGTKSLAIIAKNPELFSVRALVAGKNIGLLSKQANTFRPQYVAIQDEQDIAKLATMLDYKPQILAGVESFEMLARLDSVDTIVSAQVGAAGLRATLAATLAGKTICLANKESLILAGDLIRKLAHEHGAVILPVDSEHYALFQCLHMQDTAQKNYIQRLILTASGGPFRGKDSAFLEHVTIEQALNHPNWKMGAKITIDSASLMNKGLEVIEAYHLYGLNIEQISVLIHPQSIIHSLVEWHDASMLAQLAEPDMALPIAACLFYPHVPHQKNTGLKRLDLTEKAMTFETPDMETFPCLALAFEALNKGLCVELNAANEVAVELFLSGKIPFTHIPKLISFVLKNAVPQNTTGLTWQKHLQLIETSDKLARDKAYVYKG